MADATLVTTQASSGKVQAREDRPAIVISSTSWTADEDFGILLQALVLLDKRTSALPPTEFPNLVVVVTGKGPQKQMYLDEISELAFKRIRIVTMYKSVPILAIYVLVFSTNSFFV